MDSLEYLNSLNTRRYWCCCGRIHVKRGALLVGALELLCTIAISVLLVLAYFYCETVKLSDTVLYAGLLIGVVYALTIFLLFLGVGKERAGFLVPHMALQFLMILVLAASVALSIAVLAAGQFWVTANRSSDTSSIEEDQQSSDPDPKVNPPDENSHRTKNLSIAILIAACILFAFEIWFLNVTYKCYRFLKAKRRHEKTFGKLGKGGQMGGGGGGVFLGGKSANPFSPTDPLMPWIDE